MELSDYSVEELEEALEDKKEEKLRLDKPIPSHIVNFRDIRKMCCDYVDDIEEVGYADEDFPDQLYEKTMIIIFGKDVFKWINKFF